MTRYSKFNIIYWLQKWMDSVPGQTFLNYAYSWGASIVILGTLFKLTHIEGANLMLFIGMGTEVFVFFISAFDRPFDKTTDGMDLQTHYVPDNTAGNNVYDGFEDASQFDNIGVPENAEGFENAEDFENGEAADGGEGVQYAGGAQPHVARPHGQMHGQPHGQVAAAYNGAGSAIIIGGAPVAPGSVVAGGQAEGAEIEGAETQPGGVVMPAGGVQGGVSTAWVGQQQKITPEMAEATEKYVEELKNLTEMLGKVNEQSVRLTRDSEEMENLNRTLTGICKVYEMQLKSASQQIGTIDQINDQSKKMAQQIEQLNKIYARMIEAMTVNMRGATPPQQTGLEM